MPCYTSNTLMPLDEAQNAILHAINAAQNAVQNSIQNKEQLTLDHLLHRVLAEDIYAPINVPTFNNSAMDGYAFYHDKTITQYRLIGESLAGHAFDGVIKQGECIRIMTGAVIPQGANTVVMQEQAELNGVGASKTVTFNVAIQQGSNIRKAGGDITQGARLLAKGKRLTPVDIGLLASVGVGHAHVYHTIKVAVFSTGDELIQPNNPLKAGHIYDSNRPMLKAMLKALHIEVIDLGVVDDNKQAIANAFNEASQKAQCVITSGGVSVGEADFTREVLEEIGEVHFWKLAIKPGKPLAFGNINQCVFFGLPGNPVSSAVTFDIVAKPALLKLAGIDQQKKPMLKAKASVPFKKKPGRTDYQRAVYQTDKHGDIWVAPYKEQSSAVLSGFSGSNCYAVLEQNCDNIHVGEWVAIKPYNALFDNSHD